MKRFFIGVLLLAVAFLAGYVPMYFKKLELERSSRQTQQDLEARLVEAQDRFRISALHSELGMILIEVDQKNFGNAKDRATRFFNNVRAAISAVSDSQLRERLQPVLERRDDVISDLTTLNPEIATKLRTLYVELFATSGASQ